MLPKVLVCVCLLAWGATAAPTAPDGSQKAVEILRQEQDLQPDGTYTWNFEASDGTKAEQSGAPKPVDKETAEVVQGKASWTDPEGGQHELQYVADENGYQPQSADVPVAPEVPAQIARALEWIAAHPQPAEEEPAKKQ